jgi:hypothetical protein
MTIRQFGGGNRRSVATLWRDLRALVGWIATPRPRAAFCLGWLAAALATTAPICMVWLARQYSPPAEGATWPLLARRELLFATLGVGGMALTDTFLFRVEDSRYRKAQQT